VDHSEQHYDLLVLGAGSGNSLFGAELAHLRAAIVEPDRFGGTCLNRGCIPSKMFVVAADAALAVKEAGRLGVHATLDRVDWKAIRDRIFGRIDPISDKGLAYRRASGVDVYTEPARFVAPRVLQVGDQRLTAEEMVVAVGSRPTVPDLPGLSDVDYLTSDNVMRLDEVPASMIILGGGFVAAEMGHVFGSFGAAVTIVQRGPRLLMAEDEQVSARFTDLASARHRLMLGTEATAVERTGDGVAVTLSDGQKIEAEKLLICVGRRPNTDLIDAAAGGLELDKHGHVVTDSACRTSAEGVWALGDSANHFQLKHMANAESRLIRHNIAHPDDIQAFPHKLAPHAVFSHPQVASVGLTELQARDEGVDYVVGVRDYADAAYGWALEDTSSFVKLIADRETRLLIGAHLIGPQAATLIQPLVQAMTLGQTVDRIGHDVLYIHPALTEVVEQALLEL
jgi:mycothione reductase